MLSLLAVDYKTLQQWRVCKKYRQRPTSTNEVISRSHLMTMTSFSPNKYSMNVRKNSYRFWTLIKGFDFVSHKYFSFLHYYLNERKTTIVEVSAKKEIMYPKKSLQWNMSVYYIYFKPPYRQDKCKEKCHWPHPPRKTEISDSSRNQWGCPTHHLPNISSKRSLKIGNKSGVYWLFLPFDESRISKCI